VYISRALRPKRPNLGLKQLQLIGLGRSPEMEINYDRTLIRLRALRITAGLTLRQLEIKSRGRWKAVVVGSYERGTRHLSLKRAVELCDFYGADLSDLGSQKNAAPPEKVVFDLKRVLQARTLPDELNRIVARMLSRIASVRNDQNGQVLSVRRTDLENLQMVIDMNRTELIAALRRREILLLSENLK